MCVCVCVCSFNAAPAWLPHYTKAFNFFPTIVSKENLQFLQVPIDPLSLDSTHSHTNTKRRVRDFLYFSLDALDNCAAAEPQK